MTIPTPSFGDQMSQIAGEASLGFDPRTIELGATVEYPADCEDVDDRAWNDAASVLRARGLRLDDVGGCYEVIARD